MGSILMLKCSAAAVKWEPVSGLHVWGSASFCGLPAVCVMSMACLINRLQCASS